jgi:hypothetical protein
MNGIQEWLIKLSIVTIALLTPVQPLMLATGFLIFIDLITGIASAIKRKDKITSYKLKRTLAKILWYNIAIISAFVIEHFMIPEIPFIKGAGAMIALIEGKSVFENLHAITGIDFAKAILDKLQGKPIDFSILENKEK